MTNYIFSPSKNAFYPYLLKENYLSAGSWPDDGIDVDEAIFNEFTREPPEGKVRSAGSDGLPIWIDAPALTQEQLVAAAENERQQMLKHADAVMLDWRTELMLGEISDDNRAKLSAWMEYKNEVKAVDVTIDPEKVNWPVAPAE